VPQFEINVIFFLSSSFVLTWVIVVIAIHKCIHFMFRHGVKNWIQER
jgi:hypothetical protein